MCRCMDPDGSFPIRRALRIRAFHLRLLTSGSAAPSHSEALTLVYLPGCGSLEVNGSRTRPGAPAVIPLHRFRSAEPGPGELVFASSDWVVAREGQRFEAYAGDRLALKGAFWRKEGEEEGWRVELRGAAGVGMGVVGAGVRVRVGTTGEVVEGEVKLPPRNGRRKGAFCARLEGIPEEGDEGECCCWCREEEQEAAEEEEWEVVGESEAAGVEVEVEGGKWAVDVGIWVVCLGVGLLVSKASSSYYLGSARRKRGFLF